MPRPSLTDADRIAKIARANAALGPALEAARASTSDPNVSADERKALWAVVEEHGATIHRQSRILAGKSRGG